jgi:alpha-amylase/alpha-mannosidase (GH57 family)
MNQSRYIIIHGHFYQPPRESPWTGLIAPEPGAAPFANWNERILSECYNANAHAHVMEGRVVRIHNNYETINFNFGPTLFGWLERHGKIAYRSIKLGDEASAKRLGGYGNAMAQAYNHSIMPLLGARDKEIQVAWGIEDFLYRFGRRPEGMWLPECAVDNESLAALARAGIKYTILAPGQGRFISDGATGSEVGPFEWRQGDLSIAIFRFERELSGQIAFSDLLTDGGRLANWLADVAYAQPEGSAVMIATDGETFGHHKKTGAAELARAFSILAEREGIAVTNCAKYLAEHPARGRFEIDSPSAWSCAHGVERWRSNCGCRMDGTTSQEWRGPLRAAMEFIKDHAAAVYDRYAPALVDDPEAALRESIRMFIDANPTAAEEAFLARHKVSDENNQGKLLRLLEMQRAAQATLTSCAWFFDDFGGPEGRIVLRWAARTEELAAEFVPSIEHELLERLREVHSNRQEVGDAATLYLSLKTREARGRV